VIHESVIGEGSDPGTEDAGQMSVRKDGHVDFVPRYQRRREQRDVQDRNTVCEDVDGLVMEITETFDAARGRGQRSISIVDVRIKLEVRRHLSPLE